MSYRTGKPVSGLHDRIADRTHNSSRNQQGHYSEDFDLVKRSA